MNEIKLIGLSGQLQNGKDTVADLILKYTTIKKQNLPYNDGLFDESPWKTKRFAGILKQMTALLIGCDVLDLERDEFKNTPLSEEWRRWFFIDRKLIFENGDDGLIKKYFSTKEDAHQFIIDNDWYWLCEDDLNSEILTPRLVLQLLGTEGGRDVIHPNIWVNATLGNVKETEKIIITDCRFPNEVTGIKKRKGIVVRVVRPSKVSASTHPSETSLNDFNDWDYVIVNDGTIEELELKVVEMLLHYKIINKS
jgi:hypothetical protein